MPIVIQIRPKKLSEYLKHYGKPKIMIYFEGTDQYACSKRIPKSLMNRFSTIKKIESNEGLAKKEKAP